MVRRLIQDQKIRSGLKHFAQCETHLLPAGELPHFFLHILPGKQKAAERAAHLPAQVPRIRCPEILKHGLLGRCLLHHRFLLVKIPPLHVLPEFEAAAKCRQFSDQRL